MWTQVVGKIRVAQSPWWNHSWHVPLYLTTRGLTTSAIPHGDRFFDLEFDFLEHRLHVRTSDGGERRLRLEPRSVASFYAELMDTLEELDVPVQIHDVPNEVPNPIPFGEDSVHASYDPDVAQRLWRALLQVDRVLKQFQSGFVGKSSPVHFFWGSFDMAVTRFSGREAPPHPGGIPNLPDEVAQEAYSHEVSSAGFWPGGEPLPEAVFYSYAYPAPDGFADARVEPAAAHWHEGLGEFVLPYEAVRTASSPDDALLAFLQSTYDAAADLGRWDRAALDCAPGRPGVPRPLDGAT
jgi:hypothetical protein